MREELQAILEEHPPERASLIPLLQDIQDEFGYLPPDAITKAAHFLGIPESDVYGAATFYSQFYFTRQGRHRIKVCQGTACHVRGGHRIMQALRNELGIDPGGTTDDYRCSLERVACFGSCSQAPVMVIDERVYGQMTPRRAVELVKRLE